MAEDADKQQPAGAPSAEPASASAGALLGSATYEIIRQRLQGQGAVLRERLSQLDGRRQEVFGTVEFKLLQAFRIVTAHNCIPQDMVQLGEGEFLFGFNVQFGLKKEVDLENVFAVYSRDQQSGAFKEAGLDALRDPGFVTDFKRLYNVYERAAFQKFSVIEGKLYMVFSIGAALTDVAVFKWAAEDGKLTYIDGRAESEFRKIGFPQQYDFRWQTPDRESFRYGDHPHISIQDRVFVECVGGDLTIKVEDNTATGEGVYAEAVEDKHQKVDDAEIAYATVDHLILLKVRPYKETEARYFIFNEKTQQAVRVDSLGQSCVLLPEGHGLIFPDGFYLSTGELKEFESKERGYTIERVVHAPNGEDSLYVFYHRHNGSYVLLPYRLIPQKVEERISCNGFTLFPDGHMVLFRGEDKAQKHHTLQLRQTPFYQPGYEPEGRRESFLYQVGNKEVVRCLAECNEVLSLIRKENPYAELYTDLVKRCTAILDAYTWLNTEVGCGIDDALKQVREVADKAVDEFDKVRELQREAVRRVREVRVRAEERLHEIKRTSFNTLGDYVTNLAALRHMRGDLITLKDVRYVDVAQIEEIESQVTSQTGELSHACVKFLLKPEALEPYRKGSAEQLSAVEKITRAAEGKRLEKAVTEGAAELEMLIEVVNSLKIEDATETTRIIDGITLVYATLNQVRAAIKKRLQSLVAAESAEQFNAQLKLLSQAASSYLDFCDSPAKCEEYLNRVSVQIEEMEGSFAEFEEYTVQLAEHRAELYQAFEQRKVALIEQRNRRANALMTAAERILKVITNRLAGFAAIEDIHTYMASDLMIAKVREITQQLLELGDSVKADDLTGRLKSAQQDAVRQLKDRQELFVGGEPVIRLGKHRFNVNTQALDLTVVHRDGRPFIHLTSTKYFEEITDESFVSTRGVWEQGVVSENQEVYRGEYLAYALLQALQAAQEGGRAPGQGSEKEDKAGLPSIEEAAAMSRSGHLELIHRFMATRFDEGYTKGVHDEDAAAIFGALASAHAGLKLARYSPPARACAVVYWHRFCPEETRDLWSHKLNAFAERNRLFPGETAQESYITALRQVISTWILETRFYHADLAADAGEYLFYELAKGSSGFVCSREADQLLESFNQHLVRKGGQASFQENRQRLAAHPGSELDLIRDWVRGFLLTQPESNRYLEEVAATLYCAPRSQRDGRNGGEGAREKTLTESRSHSGTAEKVVAPAEELEAAPERHPKPVAESGVPLKLVVAQASTSRKLEGMKGSHPVIQGATYDFDYFVFQQKLRDYHETVAPRFQEYQRLKQQLIERERARLRLHEFAPRVLTSFVRNQLIDEVYLPLIGDNLAKQIGAAGDQKRTDLMGLLLVISPPGYGKTTLLEYIANRLGLIFVKINGPAIGHGTTSIDPQAAANSAAREEMQKLNLAFEMGDNVMICVDDIQHCSPEFLQKFISLCDAQRKIEGVWRGNARTYDLRGRKVVVVMAGNPYTESGQKFRIPDMLANRADTYNLGDIIGGNPEWFRASYLENSVTSNAVLAPLANKSQKDVRAFIRMAESGEREMDGFEGSYSSQQVEEILSIMRKLTRIRDVVLRVNQEYIHSAAQADEFRTEPPFRLQGSYRNMNRLAEKVVAVMNDTEAQELLLDHYRGESQTLTTGAEANLLKFKELIGGLSASELARWEEIKKTFKRNQLVRGTDQNDPIGRVVGQLSGFQAGLESIQETLEKQLSKPAAPMLDLTPVGGSLEALRATIEQRLNAGGTVSERSRGELENGGAIQLAEAFACLREDLSRAITSVHTGALAGRLESLSRELQTVHSTLEGLRDLAAQQRNHLREAKELLATRAKQGAVEIDLTQEMLENESQFLERFHQALAEAQKSRDLGAQNPETPQ